MPLTKNALKPLANNLYITTLIISNEVINDIKEIVKWLEESGLLIKGVSETIKNEAKEQKSRFHSMLLGI